MNTGRDAPDQEFEQAVFSRAEIDRPAAERAHALLLAIELDVAGGQQRWPAAPGSPGASKRTHPCQQLRAPRTA